MFHSLVKQTRSSVVKNLIQIESNFILITLTKLDILIFLTCLYICFFIITIVKVVMLQFLLNFYFFILRISGLILNLTIEFKTDK